MRIIFIAFLGLSMLYLSACAQELSNKAEQLGAAVMAAPEEDRANATVYGYDAAGKLITLKQGSNNLICISDDPNKPGFSVVCYHRDLDPFMARGRELRAEGKSTQEIFDVREAEAKSGALKMPEQPTTLHILSGKEGKFDLASNTVSDAKYRYVVYLPFATAESTGLPTRPIVPGGPWIMDPGTHKAHIMITPPEGVPKN